MTLFQKLIKLEALLQRFITPEIVQNVECPGCKKIQAQKVKQCLQEAGDAGPRYLEENPRSSCMKRLTIGKVRFSVINIVIVWLIKLVKCEQMFQKIRPFQYFNVID